MKLSFISLYAATLFLLTACGNEKSKTGHEGHNMSKDTAEQQMPVEENKDVKSVAVTYTLVDTKLAASLKTLFGHYLHVKNALANDNASEAASGAKAMEKFLKNLDKSLFTAEQKAVYDQDEEELKEHAEHIGKNADNIKHQREHFSLMSEVMYYLVKSFGAGQPVYHDHCPMYNDNNGAMWLSEVREIKNPYFGSEMFKCGRVEEVIQ